MFFSRRSQSGSRSQSGVSRRSTGGGGHRSISSRLSFRGPRRAGGRGGSAGSGSPKLVSERIYGPMDLGIGDDESSADLDLDSGIGEKLLAQIKGYYGRMKLAEVGFCFGLLDPVSNILVCEAIALSPESLQKAERAQKEEEEKEKEEEEEEEEEDAWWPPSQPIECRCQRSLDGLVAFLVALFPYLTDYRAMWYLDKADLHPLLAARLIINDRGMELTFGFVSDTTVAAVGTALRCAAAAAQHPNPRQFALGWKLLSPSLGRVATLLHGSYATQDPAHLIGIMRLLRPRTPLLLDLEQSWDLVSARLADTHPKMHPVPQVTVRRMLLTTIHGYYLQALAWLPKDQLCSHYHHSLLQAGHCYGPLDPLSNIILNTLWYGKVYPLKLERGEIEAISTKSLLRIAVRSLYGLISYLCTRYPDLTPSEAMRRLHEAGADLQKALDPILNDDGVQEAYLAAAKAARHPKPRQQALFLGPSNSKLSSFLDLITDQEPCMVHKSLLQYFQTFFARSIAPEETTNNCKVLGPWDYPNVMGKIDDFWKKHKRVVGMVKFAIDMYNKQHGVSKYELHVVCGVNEFVGGPLLATPFGRAHRFSHINFLATQITEGARPELFFAECRKVGSKGGLGLCCPVAMPLPATEQARCPYCELAGSRIVHPAKESFRGRDIELEKMLAREGVYSGEDINDDIISGSHKETLWVGYLEEDEIYASYECDNNKVEEFPMYEMR